MARTVSRSARTGRFLSKGATRRSPKTTSTERVGRGTSNNTVVHRSTITGRFVRGSTARRTPDTTITQAV